jgi:hypothetical protein
MQFHEHRSVVSADSFHAGSSIGSSQLAVLERDIRQDNLYGDTCGSAVLVQDARPELSFTFAAFRSREPTCYLSMNVSFRVCFRIWTDPCAAHCHSMSGGLVYMGDPLWQRTGRMLERPIGKSSRLMNT